MKFKKTFFAFASLIVCIAPILSGTFLFASSNQITTNKNNVDTLNSTSEITPLLTGRPTTVRNRIIVPSENTNFAQSYLNWEYFGALTTDITDKLKVLLLNNAFESLPNSATKDDIVIQNGYVDNYAGVIEVNFDLNKYYDNSGNLAPNNNVTNVLNESITISGFRTSALTEIPEQIVTDISSDINVIDTNSLSPSVNNHIINGVSNAVISLNPTSLIRYPGLKKITSDVSIDRYLIDAYVNEADFDISLQPLDGFSKIGYYASPSSPLAGTTSPLERNDVSFYGDFTSTGLTTYIDEGNILVPNQYLNNTASQIYAWNDDTIVTDILNQSAILINPYVASNVSKIEIVTKEFNDLTGILKLTTKLTNNVYYQGQTLNYATLDQDGSNRIFHVNITGFSTVKATSIVSLINIANSDVLNGRWASDFANTTLNQNTIRDTLQNFKDSSLEGIPSNDLLPPGNAGWFSSENITFSGYRRAGDGLRYVGIPNNITGELKVTIRVNWYFSPINGELITNVDNPLELTTIFTGFRKSVDDFARINSRVAMIGFETTLPQNAFNVQNSSFYQDYLLETTNNAISNPNSLLAGASIEISEQDKLLSLQDPETNNRTGNFMLHYQSRNFIDPVDGILNTNLTPGKILLGNFLNILPTSFNHSVSLEFFSLTNAPFVTDVTEANNPLKKLEDLLIRPRPGRGDLPNIANLFQTNNSNNSIPITISNWYNDPNSSSSALPVEFSNFFKIQSIIDSDDKNGTLTAEIRLNTFYQNNSQATLVEPPSTSNFDKYISAEITFLGFTPARPTDVNYLINIRNSIDVTDFNHYPSDLQKNPNTLKEIINKNKILFFRNIPENFGENNFDVTNIVANNTDGSITCSIIIKNNYFDANSNFQSVGPEKTFDGININGFLTALPTEVSSLVNISSLFYDNNTLSEGTQLEIFEKMKIDNEPTGNFVNNITYLIKNNPNIFLTNAYKIDDIATANYFIVSNPMANYGTGRLTFDLQLNYYFDDNSIPIDPTSPANNPKIYSISLTGFAINRPTSSVSRFSLEQYLDINQYTPQFLSDNPEVLKEYIFGDKANDKAPNFTIINLLFRDLPVRWTQETDNLVNNSYYTELNASITSIVPSTTQGSATVNFQLQNVFVLNNNNLEITTANFSVIFDGLNKITGTQIDGTWDLSSLSTQWGPGNAPSDQKISLMDSSEIEVWLNANIFGSGTSKRYTNFITNLIVDNNNPSIVTLETPISSKNAKTGTIVVNVKVTNIYNNDGTTSNTSITKSVNISGFATENSTFVKTRATSINEHAGISSLIVFGQNTILPSEFIQNTTNVNEILKTNINNANTSTSPTTPQINIMQLLFDNILPETKISSINITGFDDIAGSISFKASIVNYFDDNGNIIRNTPSSEFPNEFTINGLYNANPTNINKTTSFINDISSLGVFASITGNLNHLSPGEFLNNFNSQLVENVSNFERMIATGWNVSDGGNTTTYYPFAIPSNASFVGTPTQGLINNNSFGDLGALIAKVNTNSYTINEKEGILNFTVTYTNIWTEVNKTITINGTTNSVGGKSLKVVTDQSDPTTRELSINGFQQSNVLDNSLIIASIVTGSVGLIIIFAIAIYFLVIKIRTYKG